MVHKHTWKETSHNECYTTFKCDCGKNFECDPIGCIAPDCPQCRPPKLRFPEYDREFEFGGWPRSEWLLLQGWFKSRYGPHALPTDVQKVWETRPGPWPGIDKEKE